MTQPTPRQKRRTAMLPTFKTITMVMEEIKTGTEMEDTIMAGRTTSLDNTAEHNNTITMMTTRSRSVVKKMGKSFDFLSSNMQGLSVSHAIEDALTVLVDSDD